MKLTGLTKQQVEESRRKNGSNTLTQIPPDPLWKKILEGFKDPMIMILLVALAIQVVLWIMGKAEWYEPVCVLVAILLANGVASVSEHSQEGKASLLKAEEESKEMTKILRDGQLHEMHVSEVVVGDLIYLQAGDKLPADGEIVDGEIMVDQAALNGETEEARKCPNPNGETYEVKDLLNKHYAYRGTVAVSGEAYMEIKVVGDNTLFGQLALEVQEDTRETPLQVKLGKLAKQISMFGYIGAIAIIIGVLAVNILTGKTAGFDFAQWLGLVIEAVTVAVTIIICAVTPSPIRKAIMARSVELPPMISLPETVAELLRPMPVTTSRRMEAGSSFSLVNTRWLPVASSTTESLPWVMVPVLSVKSRDREPAVSRPLILRTRTLSLAMRRLWNERRMEVSIGRPSGTAHTMMVTATVTASIIRRIHS